MDAQRRIVALARLVIDDGVRGVTVSGARLSSGNGACRAPLTVNVAVRTRRSTSTNERRSVARRRPDGEEHR